jgi:hypothetical protein
MAYGSSTRHVRQGAYGLRVRGIDLPSDQFVEAEGHWPTVEVHVQVLPVPPSPAEYIDGRAARLQVRPRGSVFMDRLAGHAAFTLPAEPTASALLHPHLAAVGAVWSYWSGRESFHAGSFLAGGAAWGVLGDKGSGKSSTLAALAAAGVPILCDDVLVLDGTTAFAGPRSIDLRADAARTLGIGEPLGVIGDRERWRVALEPIQPEIPFRGWVDLRWSEEPVVRSVQGAERLRRLLEHRALRIPPHDPAALFELAGLPFLEFGRPRRWSSITAALELLLESVSG